MGTTKRSRGSSAKLSALRGKFTRPRPLRALGRERLFRTLDRGREHPAIWVAGPPGAGKTTLVSTYAEERGLRALWYRVQAADADPATFFHQFSLAVDSIAPGGSKGRLPHLTAEYLQNIPVFGRRYFEQVHRRLKGRCLLVFDDYQEAGADASLHEVLREVLESMPEGTNVIVLSRGEPPFPFAVSRARGNMVLLHGSDLKLTLEECSEIARLRGVRIERPSLERLYKRTEGWTAGVVLALEQKVYSETAGDLPRDTTPQTVFDYFGGNIFQRMPADTQALLLRMSFLPIMTGHRVAELTGSPAAEPALRDLARRNYFTLKLAQGDKASASYQFHPLFREFLLRRAEHALEPSAVAELRRKAAAILEADGELAECVDLLVAAQAWDEVLRIALANAEELLAQGRSRVLEEWLGALPAALTENAPWALHWLGMCRLGFQPTAAREKLERAFSLFRKADDAEGLFCTWAALVDSFIYEWEEFSPLDRWIGTLDELLARHPRFPSRKIESRVVTGIFTALMYRQPQRADLPSWAEWLGDIVARSPDVRVQMSLGSHLVLYYTVWLGDLVKARVVLDSVRRKKVDVAPLAYTTWCAMEASYHLYLGEYEKCLRMVNDGLETCRQTGVHVMRSFLANYGVSGSLRAGDLATAEYFLQHAASLPHGRLFRGHFHHLRAYHDLYRSDLGNALANARIAVTVADEAGVPWWQALHRLGLAHILFARGERREALRYSAEARRLARSMRLTNIEFECISSTTYFLLARGKDRVAVPLLRRVLGIARRRGYVSRPYWMPQVVARLFAVAIEHGSEGDYAQARSRQRRRAPPPEAAHAEQWPFRLKIYTLGRFSVLIDGKALEFGGKAQRRSLDLLMALIAFGGRDVSERRLIEALWSESENDTGRQACASALHRLRRLLGCDDAIRLKKRCLSLDPRYVWVDVWAFEQALALREGRRDTEGSNEDRAANLYRGPFLGRQAESTWAEPLRTRLRNKFVRDAIRRGRALFAVGRYESAIALFEGALGAEPLAEELYQALMLCYQDLGRRAEAVNVYRLCETTLAASGRVFPSSKTAAMYRKLVDEVALSKEH